MTVVQGVLEGACLMLALMHEDESDQAREWVVTWYRWVNRIYEKALLYRRHALSYNWLCNQLVTLNQGTIY